jgi:hypothetical protein
METKTIVSPYQIEFPKPEQYSGQIFIKPLENEFRLVRNEHQI